MSDILLEKKAKPSHDLYFIRGINVNAPWIKVFLSPLSISLLLTTMIRVWLTIHTHGVIAGDEAMVGIQAEHILRGERPAYYYNQPYMGFFLDPPSGHFAWSLYLYHSYL